MSGPSIPARTGPASRLALLCCCLLALGVLAACGSSGTSTASSTGSAAAAGTGTSAAPASAAMITIKDFAFTTPSKVSPGAKVTVENKDSVAHTVTADTGNAFDDQAGPGKSTFTAPTTPGTYSFHCSIHPEMHGVLVVG